MGILAACAVPHPPLLIPGVGDGEKPEVGATQKAYGEVARRIADLSPETLVVFSPHAPLYRDYLHISPGTGAQGDFRQFGLFGSGRFEVDYDQEFVGLLERRLEEAGIPGGAGRERDSSLDHGTMVPLQFIEQELAPPLQIVRVGLSGLDARTHYRFGQCVSQVADELDRRTVIVASGDLSHRLKEDGPYGFAPEGPLFDTRVTRILQAADFKALLSFDEDFCDRAGECGLRSFIMMAGALDGTRVKPCLLSYEGPFGVGYGIAYFTVVYDGDAAPEEEAESPSVLPDDRTAERPSLPVAIAQATITTYLEEGRRPNQNSATIASVLDEAKRDTGKEEGAGHKEPGQVDAARWHRQWLDLSARQAGTFVSLYKGGELRGCIGTIAPTTSSVIDEIIQNAVSAAAEDPRFPPVRVDELPGLEYSVDILGPAEPIDAIEQLDTQRYGVIVSRGARRGLLLPALDGVDTPEQQVAIALRKAGIGQREDYRMERFEVVRYH